MEFSNLKRASASHVRVFVDLVYLAVRGQETCLERRKLRRCQSGNDGNFFKSVGIYFDLPQQGRVHMTEEVKTVSCCPALLLVPAEAATPKVPLSAEPIPD